MSWVAKPTGDMTLSILDEEGFQILKVDMLSAGTMKAGTEGDILARTLNDLQIIAHFSEKDFDISDDNLMFPGGEISQLPWTVIYDQNKRKLVVKSGKKTICDRIFPKSISEKQIYDIIDIISNGVSTINTLKQ